MTTIGDLTLNDIGKTSIALGTGPGRIEGLIHYIGTDVDMEAFSFGPRFSVGVNVNVGGVMLTGLDRDHPCEVIS